MVPQLTQSNYDDTIYLLLYFHMGLEDVNRPNTKGMEREEKLRKADELISEYRKNVIRIKEGGKIRRQQWREEKKNKRIDIKKRKEKEDYRKKN